MAARKLHLGKDKSGDAVSSGVRKSEKIRKGTMRGRAVRSAQVAHNHQVAGSNPAPAIMGLARKRDCLNRPAADGHREVIPNRAPAPF